jgi:hypothetical protein
MVPLYPFEYISQTHLKTWDSPTIKLDKMPVGGTQEANRRLNRQ